MLSHLHVHDPFDKLQREISGANLATADLVLAVLDLALARCALSDRGEQANRIHELIGAQAWTDAMLALVALDRSRVLRHVIYEEGEWRCTLGSLWPLPAWVDDTIEFAHGSCRSRFSAPWSGHCGKNPCLGPAPPRCRGFGPSRATSLATSIATTSPKIS